MLKSISKRLAVVVASLALLVVPVVTPVAVSAQTTTDCLKSGSNYDKDGFLSEDCSQTDVTAGSNRVSSLARDIINIFSVIVGLISVIMIIYGGFRYITSGGDSGKVTGAKNTLIYAIVGLVIVALAQFIVQFVLQRVGSSTV